MKTYPIIFSGPMVRALLEGRKFQTRRLITSMWSNVKMHHEMGSLCSLYVRETFAACGIKECINGPIAYRASWARGMKAQCEGYKEWRPSIHMPRWASRLTLEVTDVRLQRLQDIHDDDKAAEGATEEIPFGSVWKNLHTKPGTRYEDNPEVIALTFRVHHCNVDDFIKQKAA